MFIIYCQCWLFDLLLLIIFSIHLSWSYSPNMHSSWMQCNARDAGQPSYGLDTFPTSLVRAVCLFNAVSEATSWDMPQESMLPASPSWRSQASLSSRDTTWDCPWGWIGRKLCFRHHLLQQQKNDSHQRVCSDKEYSSLLKLESREV